MERRLAAILVADVVAYSRHMGENETRTLGTLKQHRADFIEPGIRKHGGHIIKYMGDGLLAEFPSAVEAVTCAVEIQRELKEDYTGNEPSVIRYRIGINVGDIMVEEGDLYGDGVNIAARMESLAEPGGICISGQVYDQVRNKIGQAVAAMGEQRVKNIAEPVRVYRIKLDPAATAGRGEFGSQTSPHRQAFIIILASVALLGGGLLLWKQASRSPESNHSKPASMAQPAMTEEAETSIAVLPFANLSHEEDQAYFADGMTDDIITELTKIPGLLVISRDSSFSYRQASPDLRKLAGDFNVRFVLQGSVRKSGDRVRINANLVEATTGKNLWGDRYDGELVDVFTLQDRITAEIVTALSLKLGGGDSSERARIERSDLGAYEIFLQGRDIFQRFSREDTYQARQLFEQAIERNPQFARAHAMLAWTHAFEYNNGWSEKPGETLETALKTANQALLIDDSLPVAHFVKGLVLREQGHFSRAELHAQKAIDINPSYANGHILLATILYYEGEAALGLELIEKAEKINPLHPSNYPFHKGQALFILKRYDEAIEAFGKGLEKNPSSQRMRVWLAATYAQVGRSDDAQWEVNMILTEDPHFRIDQLHQIFPFQNAADKEHFNTALVKLGLEVRG